jgi:Ca-activated chloride channel family protein
VIEISVTALRWIAASVVPLSVAALALYIRRRRWVAGRLGDREIVRSLLGIDLHLAPWARLTLVAAAALALALALLDPSLASARPRSRGPVVLLLDASGSMLADDARGSRLEAERAFARSLVAELADMPVGIVAFAGRAFSLTPPTRDRGSIEMYLAALDPSIVTQSGSALGAALRQGIGLLSASGSPNGGTIVLIGDGDETDDAGAGLDAAALARQSGVFVHTVGVGSELGAPVPALDPMTGSTVGFLRDPGGEVLISRRSEELLRGIARRGGGAYVAVEDPGAISDLTEAIRGAGAADSATADGEQIPRYIWFAAVALLLLFAEPAAASVSRVR